MQPHTPHLIPKSKPGEGKITVARYGPRVVISELAFSYPLRLTAPQINQPGVAEIFMLTYGGGLVGGDQNRLEIDVGPRATLVLRSQGSTKVFKTRPEQRDVAHSVAIANAPSLTDEGALPFFGRESTTVQTMNTKIGCESGMFLLPDPVTCYRSASYNQTQTFHLFDKTSSLVLLDWYTSGRGAMGEEWDFTRYYSNNEVWLNGKRLAKDVTLLEKRPAGSTRTLASRLMPYNCYAMIVLCGPVVEGIICQLVAEQKQVSVFKARNPPELMWSLSPLSEDNAVIVRVCATKVEAVKGWIGNCLMSIRDIIGTDVYRSLFQQ